MSHAFISSLDVQCSATTLAMLFFSILWDSLPQSLHIAFTIIVPISVGIVPCKIDLGHLFWSIQRLIRFLVHPCGTAKTDHFFFPVLGFNTGPHRF